jgi:hypothetical protein
LGVIAHTIEGDYATAVSFYKRCLEVSSSPSVICAIDDGGALLDATNLRVLLCLCAALTRCRISLHSLAFLPVDRLLSSILPTHAQTQPQHVIAAQNLKLLAHVSIPPATGILTLVRKSEKFLRRSQHKHPIKKYDLLKTTLALLPALSVVFMRTDSLHHPSLSTCKQSASTGGRESRDQLGQIAHAPEIPATSESECPGDSERPPTPPKRTSPPKLKKLPVLGTGRFAGGVC